MHPSSIPKSANQDTFESGARAMTEAVNAGGTVGLLCRQCRSPARGV